MRWVDKSGNRSQRVRFHENNENDEILFFAFLCIFGWFLNCGCFLCKAYQMLALFQNWPTGQPAKPDKYYQQKNSKRPPVVPVVPCGTKTVIGAMVYRQIPSARAIQPPSLDSALLVTTGCQ